MNIGHTIIWIDELDSTNRYITRNKNLAPGTIVAARFQTDGRGQRGNTWESNANENLTFSIFLTPSFVGVQDQFMLSKAASLGIKDYLNSLLPNISIKWPNDLYVSKSKIAGILIENSVMGSKIESSTIGIGLNVNQLVFPDDLPNPTSLALETGMKLDIESSLEEVAKCLNQRFNQLEEANYQSISNDYYNSLYQLETYYKYSANGITFEAKIVGVKNSGEIVVQKANGETLSFGFKELVYLSS